MVWLVALSDKYRTSVAMLDLFAHSLSAIIWFVYAWCVRCAVGALAWETKMRQHFHSNHQLMPVATVNETIYSTSVYSFAVADIVESNDNEFQILFGRIS